MNSENNYTCFSVTIENHIAHVSLNRPNERNTMNRAFWLELPRCVNAIETETDARVIVISSEGKHFSAGMDLAVFNDSSSIAMSEDPGRMAENLRRLVLQLQDSLNCLERVRLPVLVAIQGGCIGGALDLVCAADSRYCTQDAFFTIKETELGMTADVGTLQRLPKLMPQGLVRELAYTGRKFSAEEAREQGLVNRVFEDADSMINGVMAIAADIAANSPLAVTGCKEMLNYSRDHTVADSLNYVATWQAGMFRPNDMMLTFQAQAQQQAAEYPDLLPVRSLFDQE